MNTFLITQDHNQTARCLDPERLNRCLTDAVQVAKVLVAYDLLRDGTGKLPFGVMFPNVIKLWVSNSGVILLPELRQYYNALHQEWLKIHSNKPHATFYTFNWQSVGALDRSPYTVVWNDDVHLSHRAKLLSKDKNYYFTTFEREKISFAITEARAIFSKPEIVT